MQKLFRFQYEPCVGTCYAGGDRLPDDLRNLTLDLRRAVVAKIVETHDMLCDDPALGFGVDFDASTGKYIGTSVLRGRLDVFSAPSFTECVETVCAHVQAVLRDAPANPSAAECNYGKGGVEHLAEDILGLVA